MGIIGDVKNFFSGGLRQVMYKRVLAEASAWGEKIADEEGWDKLTGKVGQVTARNRATVTQNKNKNFNRYLQDGFVKRGVALHTDFTYGNGIQIPKAKSEEIQEKVVDPTWNDPTNQRNVFSFYAQQKRHKEFQIGGELNLLVKMNPANGRVKFINIVPDDIEDVVSDPEDKERPAFYLLRESLAKKDLQTGKVENAGQVKKIKYRAFRYKLDEASPAELERGLVYHIGQNELFHIMRGMPDMSSIRDAADVAKDMTEDGATLSKANAEVAFKTKMHKGGKKGLDDMMTFLRTKTDGSNPAPAVGSDWIENQHLDRNWMQERNTGSNYREKDLRAVKLYLFAAFGMGEHYFGDPATGNLATAESMELPVLKMTEAEQKLWESIYKDLFNFAIDYAVVVGKVKGSLIDWDEFEVECEEDRRLDIDFPPILNKNVEQYTRAVRECEAANLITSEEATRLIAQALGSNNVDEIIEELYSKPQIDLETDPAAAARLGQEGEVTPPASQKASPTLSLENYEKGNGDNGNGNGNGGGEKFTSVQMVK